MKKVIFTDETRATLDGPDGWGKGWVANGQERHCRFKRQQGGDSIMIWAGKVGDGLIDLFVYIRWSKDYFCVILPAS